MEINPRAAYLPITLTKGEPVDFLLNLQTWSEVDIDLGNCTVSLEVAGVRSGETWHVDVKGSAEFPGSVVLNFPDVEPGRYTYEVWADFGSEEPTLHTRKQKLIEGGLTMISSLAAEYDAGTLPELAVGHRQIVVRCGPAEKGLIKANILYPGYMAEKMESARKSAEAAKKSENNAKESEQHAKQSEEAAKKSEAAAKQSEQAAAKSAQESKSWADNAKNSAESARKSEEEAKKSEGKSSYEHWLEKHPGGTFEEYMFELSGEEWMRDHVEDDDIHVQDGEREKWNSGLSDLQAELAEAMKQLSQATNSMAEMAEKLQGTQEGVEAAKVLGEAAKEAAAASQAVAEAAKALAEAAKGDAEAAQKDAAAAKSAAQGAQSAAQAAQSTASEAKSTAGAAQSKAEAAEKTAQQALEAAQAAQSTASDALAQAKAAVEAAKKASSSPPGTIVAFAGQPEKIPSGWLDCDGRELNKSDYPALYEAIGTTWGGDAAAGKFNLPKLNFAYLQGYGLVSTEKFYLSTQHIPSRVGDYLDAALPNIEGNVGNPPNAWGQWSDEYSSGPFSVWRDEHEGVRSQGGGTDHGVVHINFDASKANPTYGRNRREMNPNAAVVCYIIKT